MKKLTKKSIKREPVTEDEASKEKKLDSLDVKREAVTEDEPSKEKKSVASKKSRVRDYVEVSAKVLNVRVKPSMKAQIIGRVFKGEKFLIIERVTKDRINWGKSNELNGWINSAHVRVRQG